MYGEKKQMKKNKMLRVNLSTGNIDSMTLSEDLENNFMGGEGLGTRLVWDMVPPKADPLGHGTQIVNNMRGRHKRKLIQSLVMPDNLAHV